MNQNHYTPGDVDDGEPREWTVEEKGHVLMVLLLLYHGGCYLYAFVAGKL